MVSLRSRQTVSSQGKADANAAKVASTAEQQVPATPRTRSRAAKEHATAAKPQASDATADTTATAGNAGEVVEQAAVKRPRGRPPKAKPALSNGSLDVSNTSKQQAATEATAEQAAPATRGRVGRPPKAVKAAASKGLATPGSKLLETVPESTDEPTVAEGPSQALTAAQATTAKLSRTPRPTKAEIRALAQEVAAAAEDVVEALDAVAVAASGDAAEPFQTAEDKTAVHTRAAGRTPRRAAASSAAAATTPVTRRQQQPRPGRSSQQEAAAAPAEVAQATPSTKLVQSPAQKPLGGVTEAASQEGQAVVGNAGKAGKRGEAGSSVRKSRLAGEPASRTSQGTAPASRASQRPREPAEARSPAAAAAEPSLPPVKAAVEALLRADPPAPAPSAAATSSTPTAATSALPAVPNPSTKPNPRAGPPPSQQKTAPTSAATEPEAADGTALRDLETAGGLEPSEDSESSSGLDSDSESDEDPLAAFLSRARRAGSRGGVAASGDGTGPWNGAGMEDGDDSDDEDQGEEGLLERMATSLWASLGLQQGSQTEQAGGGQAPIRSLERDAPNGAVAGSSEPRAAEYGAASEDDDVSSSGGDSDSDDSAGSDAGKRPRSRRGSRAGTLANGAGGDGPAEEEVEEMLWEPETGLPPPLQTEEEAERLIAAGRKEPGLAKKLFATSRERGYVNRVARKAAPDTAGKKWYDLPATTITDDVKRDLRVLRLRGAMDPKRFYKGSDGTKFPKYFQFGTVVEGPADYYSGRLTNRERKQTLTEELLADPHMTQVRRKRFLKIQDENQRWKHKKMKTSNERLKRKSPHIKH